MNIELTSISVGEISSPSLALLSPGYWISSVKLVTVGESSALKENAFLEGALSEMLLLGWDTALVSDPIFDASRLDTVDKIKLIINDCHIFLGSSFLLVFFTNYKLCIMQRPWNSSRHKCVHPS